jgi:hypothetical protein
MIRPLLAVLLISLSITAFGQAKEQNENSLKGVPFKERIVTGGGLGLGFGSVQDYISISPVIGYSITKKFMGGTGVTYRYTNYKIYSPSIKLTDYAVNPFLRYTIYKGFFVQTEFEYLNYEFPITTVETTRMSFESFMAGGGLIQPVGRNLAFYVMALYNFSYRDPVPGRYSPYTSPFVLRAGINIGGFLGL